MALVFRGVEISDLVEGKINGKHHVTADDVCEAIGNHWQLGWLPPEPPERERRLLVRGPTDQGRILNIVLYPVDEALGEWRLATAFPERD